MGRIIFDAATSLNGWIADQDGSLDWLFAVDLTGMPERGLVPDAATVLVEGSSTYEWVLRTEALLEHPEKWQQFYARKPTFVLTTRSLPVPAGADVRFVSGPVADLLPQLRDAAGEGDIWVVGGGELAGQFLDAGALDVIALTVAPVALTGGAPPAATSDRGVAAPARLRDRARPVRASGLRRPALTERRCAARTPTRPSSTCSNELP